MQIRKLVFFFELMALGGISFAFAAALSIDPASPTFTLREAVLTIGGAFLGGVYAIARLLAPWIVGQLNDARAYVWKQLTGGDAPIQ